MNQLMTQAEYAVYRGVGRSAVSNWKKAGNLVFAEDGEGRLKVDVMRSDARINTRIDPMRGRPSGTSGQSPSEQPVLPMAAADRGEAATVSSERLDLLREQRTGQALKNAKAAGDLVPLVEGVRLWGEAARTTRERMQSELRGIAEQLANETQTRLVMALLEQTVDRVFADIAAEIEAGDDDDDADDDAAAAA